MNTISNRAVTRKQIQSGMEEAILKGCGGKVEITMMGENSWSICGRSTHANKAMAFLEESNLAKEFGERSALDGEVFIYFKTGA